MKKGEIWLASLDPSQDKEQKGFRPVIIISGDAMNDNLGLVIICPLTSRLKNFIGNIILEPSNENGLSVTSEVLVFHIRSISQKRLVTKLGIVTGTQISSIVDNLNKILRF